MDVRDQAAYSIAEAAFYLHLSRSTLRAWCVGQQAFRAVIAPASMGPPPTLSFVNLVEAYVLRAIRQWHRVPLPKIRKAMAYLKRHFGTARPLAEERFLTDGIDLFVEQCGVLITATEGGQTALKQVLEPYLTRIERASDGLPIRLYPLTRQAELHAMDAQPKVIVIDPNLASGRAVISGTGVPAVVVAERHKAGESIHDLAEDYGRKEEEIEEVLRLMSAA